jgi:hypothetical protein
MSSKYNNFFKETKTNQNVRLISFKNDYVPVIPNAPTSHRYCFHETWYAVCASGFLDHVKNVQFVPPFNMEFFPEFLAKGARKE